MAFTPPSAGLSSEPINATTQSDWAFENANIGILDGSLCLVPTNGSAAGGTFPGVNWTANLDLTNYTLPSDEWALGDNSGNGANPWASDMTDVTTFPWDNNAPYALKFDTPLDSTDYFKVSQLSSGTTFDTSTIDTAAGLTIELELLVESESGSEATGHILYVHNGSKFWTIYFRPQGVQIGSFPFGIIMPADLTLYRTVRVGIKGDQVTVGIDDGSVAVFTDAGSNNVAATEISYGKIAANPNDGAVSYLRNLKILTGEAVVDAAAPATITYSADPEVAVSPAFAPSKAVRRFSALAIATSGVSDTGETTKLQTQYNNSNVSDWTNSGALTTVTGNTTIDLTEVPTAGDGSDQLRFQFEMDGTGTGQPTKIDGLSLSTVYEEALVRAFPNWGPVNGGNTVALELFNTEGLQNPISTATDSKALLRLDEVDGANVLDEVQAQTTALTGTGFTRAVSSPTGNETTLGDEGAVVAGETFSAGISGGVAATAAETTGTHGTNVVPVVAAGGQLVEFSQPADVDQSNTTYTAQRCVAGEEGEGFNFSFLPNGNGNMLAQMRLKVESGEVQISLDNTVSGGSVTSGTYSSLEWSESKALSLITESLKATSACTLSIVAVGGPATFQISNPKLKAFDEATLAATFTTPVVFDGSNDGDPNAGWAVDAFITVHSYNLQSAPVLYSASTSTTDLVKTSINTDGIVSADVLVGGVSTTLVSTTPLIIGKRQNVAVSFYRRTSTATGYLALLIDGEVVALERSNNHEGPITLSDLALNSSTGTEKGHFTIGQLHLQDTPVRPETHAQSLGLADVFFQDALQIPALTGNGSSTPKTLSLLHFNETAGPYVDDNAFWALPTAEVIVPRESRNLITRGVSGIAGTAITMNQAGFDLVSSGDFNDLTTNRTHSIFFYMAAMTPQTTSDIVNYVSNDDHGYSIQINTDGHIVVNVFEGSTTAVRSEVITGAVVGDFAWHAIGVTLEPASGKISVYVDAYSTEVNGVIFSNYLSGTTYDFMHVGYGAYMSLDQFTVLEGLVDSSTMDIWRLPNTVKGAPTNEVFIDGIQLAADRVLPVSNRMCYAVMPEHAAGEAHISVSFSGVSVSAEQPYSYVASYSREIDGNTIPSAIKRTVSPFRVLDTVPDGQINLAYLDTRDISPETNIQTIDLSDLDPDNLSNYLQGEFILSAPVDGASSIIYTGQIDTKDFNLSNRSSAWRSGTTPQPLFHKYLAGRGRYYVSVPGANVTDVDVIRRTVLLTDKSGQSFGRDEFPWDIEVSDIDKNGNQLPSGVFSVCIFTRFPYLDGETVFVSFRAADSLRSYKAMPGHREILNTVPIFTKASGTERDTYTLELQPDATYTLTIRTE